jgi:hypothetical protein
MDAILALLVKNKEFGTLVVIMFFTIAQYYQNRGRFELQNEKIENVEKRQDKTDLKVEKTGKSVQRMEPQLNDMHKWFQKFMDDKWGHNAKKEN